MKSKMKTAIEHEPITIERIERSLALCARLVVLDGPVVIPLFERLERELAAARAEQDTVERAKRLLESYRDGEQATFHKRNCRVHRT
jgi:hypothetical protein